MANKNYLIEGVSGTGKSSVCAELKKRGYQAIDGDKELAYQGNPETGEKTESFTHQNHIWDVEKARETVADKSSDMAFFCGGSRNFDKFIDLFDEVFVLDIDAETLEKRLDARPEGAWGKSPEQRKLILQLHKTKEDIPSNATLIDATKPLDEVIDEILIRTQVKS